MTRFLELEGCFNFRDLGGYRTSGGGTLATGLLYRSDGLHRLTARGRDGFAALGIRTVLDLRAEEETLRRPWTPPENWRGRRRVLPLRPEPPVWSATELERADPAFAAEHYLDTTRTGATALGAAFTELTAPERLPAVFHCAAGKDRTGVLAALLLAVLGVSEEVIAADYALSEQATARWVASLAAGNEDDTPPAFATLPPAMLHAKHETMLVFLRGITELHGSVTGFLTGLGVREEQLDRLRSALVR